MWGHHQKGTAKRGWGTVAAECAGVRTLSTRWASPQVSLFFRWGEARKGPRAAHLPSKERSSYKHRSPAWWPLHLYISLSVSFSVLFIFSYKLWASIPVLMAETVKHAVPSHPAKHKPNMSSWERATNSLLPLGTLQPQQSSCSCCDRWDSHPQETLPKVPRNWALPIAETYCSTSEAGDVLGERLFPGVSTTRQSASLTPLLSKEELSVCILVSWLWNLADTSFWEGFQWLEE